MKSNRQHILFLWLGIILSPLLLLTLLVGLSLVNPMGLMFLTSFRIHNQSGEDLWVTPIGAIGPSGQRHTLPISVGEFPYLIIPSNRDFHIPPGDSRHFTYDWDDIQFSEILVRSRDNVYFIVLTGLHPTEEQYRRPEAEDFTIPPLAELQPASKVHTAALSDGPPYRMIFLYALALIGLASPIFLVKAFLARKSPEQSDLQS